MVSSDLGEVARRLPWVLLIDRPGMGIFRDVSNANIELIRIVQSSNEFRTAFSELRDDWRRDALIHCDLRWDNFLVPHAHAPTSPSRALKLVDWEFATHGDSCWDVGCVLSEFLTTWWASIPFMSDEEPSTYIELATTPLECLHPAISAFWRAYTSGMSIDEQSVDEHLRRSVRFAALRLVQSAFERMQGSTQFDATTVCLLQLSVNILQRPYEAIVHLFGLRSGA